MEREVCYQGSPFRRSAFDNSDEEKSSISDIDDIALVVHGTNHQIISINEVNADGDVYFGEKNAQSTSTVDSTTARNPINSPWKYELLEASLPEVNGTIDVPDGNDVSWLRKFMSFVGPGAMVAVGYMDVSFSSLNHSSSLTYYISAWKLVD
jgi:hypothetical protein